MARQRFLVTGATGDTGSHTVEQLLTRGHQVRALAHREDNRSKQLQKIGAEVVIGDFPALRKSQRSPVASSVRTLRISRRTSMPSQNRLAKPAMLFSKSTAEQSQSNCKKEFSLERLRLLRRSAGGSQ